MELNETILTRANQVLETFIGRTPRLRVSGFGRLEVRSAWGSMSARVSPNNGSLAGRYGNHGMGGTSAMAVGQLIRWYRNQSRLPIDSWRYWASDTIKLCSLDTVALLEDSTYSDPKKVCCVLCGSSKVGDWWNLNGKTGPCCHMGRCRKD
jgi:hypothetical protein